MISAQNHRQLLNGSKWLTLMFVILFAASSCDFFRKAQGNTTANRQDNKEEDNLDEITGKRVYDPETGTYVVVDELPKENMDTIYWRETSTSDYPSILSEGVESASGNLVQRIGLGENGSELFSSYIVSVFLPYATNSFNAEQGTISPVSTWAMHYYAGTKIALDELEEEGVKLNVSVFDSEGSPRQVSSILSREDDLQTANLIIGPYRGETVSLVASFVTRNNATFVSPYFVPNTDNQRNPNYIQVKPSIKSHCEALVNHARKYYDTDQIVVVSRNTPDELQAVSFLQNENRVISGGQDTTRFEEYIISVDEQSQSLDEVDVLPLVELRDTTVFIVPSWSNELFVYSFLRKLDLTRSQGNAEIIVYGMPQWTSFERIDFDYYDKLNVHVSSSSYLNPVSEEVQEFKRVFFERFGIIPNEEAYLGRDVMLYFGRMLKKHGTKFQYALPGDPGKYLHTYFEFDRVVIPTTTGEENLPTQKFENKFLNILKFEDFQFKPVE